MQKCLLIELARAGLLFKIVFVFDSKHPKIRICKKDFGEVQSFNAFFNLHLNLSFNLHVNLAHLHINLRTNVWSKVPATHQFTANLLQIVGRVHSITLIKILLNYNWRGGYKTILHVHVMYYQSSTYSYSGGYRYSSTSTEPRATCTCTAVPGCREPGSY